MPRAWELAEEVATELLRRGAVTAEAPIDIRGLVTRFGLGASEVDIRQDGRFVPGPPPAILLKKGQPEARTRFTIAHELAHWALAAPDLDTAEIAEAFSSEEMLCNSVGASLLMPRQWLLDRFPQAPGNQSMEMLKRVAGEAQVSLSAAIIRLRDIHSWDKTLLHWSRIDGRWTFDGEAGVRSEEQGAIVPCASVDFVLSEASNSGRWIQQHSLPLRIFRREWDIAAEVLPQRGGATVLVDAPRKFQPH